MGGVCGGGQVKKQKISSISISGKHIKTINQLKSRFKLENQAFPIYKVAQSNLYYALTREITKKQQQQSQQQNKQKPNNRLEAIQKGNEEFEFLDIRKKEDYINSHLISSLFIDPEDEDPNNILKKSSNLKIMLNFKTIYFIHDLPKNNFDLHEIADKIQKVLDILKANNIKIKEANIPVQEFAIIEKQFPFFVQKKGQNLIQISEIDCFSDNKQLPVLLFNNEEFVQDIQNPSYKKIQKKAQNKILPESAWKIFIHTLQKVNKNMETDQNFYKNYLNVQHIIFANSKKVFLPEQIYKISHIDIDEKSPDFKTNCIKLMNKLWENLNNQESTLIIHDSQITGSGYNCIHIIKAFLYEKMFIHERDIEEYIQTHTSKNVTQRMSVVVEPKKVFKNMKSLNEAKDSAPLLQFSDYVRIEFTNFHKECKKNKQITEKLKNMLTTMIDKIIENPDEAKFRTIKKDNKVMNENILKYKAGVKLLEMIGFKEQDSVYLNDMESKFAKIIKIDLSIGYNNFMQANN